MRRFSKYCGLTVLDSQNFLEQLFVSGFIKTIGVMRQEVQLMLSLIWVVTI